MIVYTLFVAAAEPTYIPSQRLKSGQDFLKQWATKPTKIVCCAQLAACAFLG
jgi:hypothetical protein